MIAKKNEKKNAHKKTMRASTSQPVVEKPAAQFSAPTSVSPPAIPPSRAGLTFQQKVALIGGALLLVFVLGTALLPSSNISDSNDNYLKFKTALENSNQSGIIMDLRGAPAEARQKILQCGVDLIFSGFFSSAKQDLLVYSCDETGCMSSRFRNDLSNSMPQANNATVPFSDALYGMAGRPYFHILYAAQTKQPIYTPIYSEVFIASNSNESCAISMS